MEYFKSPEKLGETQNVEICIEEVYNDILNENNNFKLNEKTKNYSNYKDHPFFKLIIEGLEKTPQLDGESSKCDEIFADYIVKVAKLTNDRMFVKVLKFVFLFRECLNDLYKDKVKDSPDSLFSEITNAEDAPDISNEFVTDYLETDSEKYGFSKDDAIDLTQNFCQWLYDNNFTCSKLSLINNNY